jgi:hypothetical protein
MAAWFSPTETFLKRITKKMMASAVTEAGGAPEIASAILGLAQGRGGPDGAGGFARQRLDAPGAAHPDRHRCRDQRSGVR